MGCFCHQTLDALNPLLPQLQVSASEALALPKLSAAVTASLKAGLPAPPAIAASASIAATPSMQLSLAAIGTISALADLRASVQEQFGIDLLVGAQAAAFARIVATLNERLSALVNLSLNVSPWLQLAALNAAIELARSPPASVSATASLDAALPALAGPAVLLAAAVRLNVDFSANVSAQLAAALRTLRGLGLPALAAPRVMATLTTALSAMMELRANLGLDPLKVGFAVAAQVVSAKLQAALRLGLEMQLAAALSVSARASLQANLRAALQTALEASAETRVQMTALAAINWQVPPITALPAITIGLPVCALSAQLKAALGIDPVRLAPCGSGCDAAKLARALR
jgi:hypothetical protein